MPLIPTWQSHVSYNAYDMVDLTSSCHSHRNFLQIIYIKLKRKLPETNETSKVTHVMWYVYRLTPKIAIPYNYTADWK